MIHIKDKYSRTNIYIQREQSSTDYVTKDYYNDKLKELKKYIDDTIYSAITNDEENIDDAKLMDS